MRYLISITVILLTLIVIPGVIADVFENQGINPDSQGTGGFLTGFQGNQNQLQSMNQNWFGNQNWADNKYGYNQQNMDQVLRVLQQRGIDVRQLQNAIASKNWALVQQILSRYQNMMPSGINMKNGQFNQLGNNKPQNQNNPPNQPGQIPGQNPVTQPPVQSLI
jgi:hypothetical protein